MIVVVKIGTSSITGDDGRDRRRRDRASSAREVAALRARGPPRSCWSRSGAIAAGLPALGLGASRPTRRRHPPGGRRGRPEPAHGASTTRSLGRARPRRRPGAARPARLRGPPAVPARPRRRCAGCSSSAWCRSSTRTTPSPTTRSASATTTASPRSSPTWSAPTCSCCSPTRPGCSPPTPASTPTASLIEEIVEVDARARGAWPAAPAATRGSGGMASQARRGQDRGLVGRAGGDRRGRRARACCADAVAGDAGVGTVVAPRGRAPARAASSGSRSPSASPGSVVVDDGRPAGAARAAAVSLLPAGVARGRGRLRRRRRGRDRRARRRGRSPRASCRLDAAGLRAVAGRRTGDLPDGHRRTRSSTATTSSSSPE